jgi:DivIVA domain-containing protein
MDEQATAQATIARIRDARFRTRRWGGYDDRKVDTFLDELIARLDRGESAGLGAAPVFTGARLRPGYRKADVDAFLKELGVYPA